MRTANPALNEKIFRDYANRSQQGGSMTIQGAVNKTAILLFCLMLTATWTWSLFFNSWNPATVTPWVFGGAIGGFIVAMITVFKKEWAPVTAPVYALLEGLFIGGISAIFEAKYPGIVIQAVGLTFGTLGGLLLAYKSGMIKATENFKMGVVAATGGIALVYVISIIMGMFGMNMPFIHESGTFGILFSLFVVVIAALNLVLDFDFIEQGAQRGAPAFMEWYAAFGLMVTLVWLYVEILRLLSKLNSRR